MKTYLCYHLEYMDFGDGPVVDGLPMHVASTKAKAEKYIKENQTDSHSWWELIEFKIDEPEKDKTLGFYGCKGGKLKNAPRNRALKAFKKIKAKT